MPFQVVFSARQAPMSNITGVDIPTEKVNFCQIYVTLEAKVFGTLDGVYIVTGKQIGRAHV